MSDRELLEAAARAAGMTGMKWTGNGMSKMIDPSRPETTGSIGPIWDPRNDAAQALHLAAKLRIDVCHNHPADQQPWVLAERQGCEGCFDAVTCIEDEFDESGRLDATCRAITRAAAEIGRAEDGREKE